MSEERIYLLSEVSTGWLSGNEVSPMRIPFCVFTGIFGYFLIVGRRLNMVIVACILLYMIVAHGAIRFDGYSVRKVPEAIRQSRIRTVSSLMGVALDPPVILTQDMQVTSVLLYRDPTMTTPGRQKLSMRQYPTSQLPRHIVITRWPTKPNHDGVYILSGVASMYYRTAPFNTISM